MLGSCWILIPQTPAKLHTSHFVLCHSATNSSLWHWCRVGTMTLSSACDGDSGKSDWCELAFSVLLNQFALESYRIVLRSCQRTFWMTPRPSHKFREFPSLSMASGYAQKVCWQIFHSRGNQISNVSPLSSAYCEVVAEDSDSYWFYILTCLPNRKLPLPPLADSH